MRLKYKTLLICLGSILFTTICMFVLSKFIIIKYINRIETKDLNNGYEVLTTILNREEMNLENTARDWSHWDEAYYFMSGKNKQSFIQNNLRNITLDQLDLDFIFFVNKQGNMAYSVTKDTQNETKNLLIKKLFYSKSKITTFKNNHEIHSGILNVFGKIFIISASPIITSDEKSKINGSLIIGRYIDKSLLDYMRSTTKYNIKLEGITSPRKIINNELKYNNSIETHRLIKDIDGDYSVVSSISMMRYEYNTGKFYLEIFIFCFILVLIIATLLSILIINKYILNRLRAVNKFIDSVSKTKDTKSRLYISGEDEIGNIAYSINKMLFELETAYKDKMKMDERFKLVLSSTNDGYTDYNAKTHEFYVSPGWDQYFGCGEVNKDADFFTNYMHNIHPDSIEAVKERFQSFINSKEDYYEDEFKMIESSGNIIWVLIRGRVVERDIDGSILRMVSTILDITNRKEYEEKIYALSCSDIMTGLKNRAYIEQKLSELDKLQTNNYSIIMGDVNGLKIVNDTFGHKEGDRLICAISSVLKKCCADDDIIARWGGDEFIILIINKESEYVSHLISNIKNKCEKISGFSFNISIALGSAKKSGRLKSEGVMNLAEEKMFRSKLMNKKSSRNATIKSLEKTLYEKHSETEEHTERVKKLSVNLGKKINLLQEELEELELLSSLHDIGKIGIPDTILMKPDKLTAEEWKIMKRHAEIGYRIAKATPGLSHVANEILCHHEKFDGTGYPRGLKGEKIPILARIINIVDSFDVMTHKRIYKDAFNIDYAIEELERCSGTQFDPVIVNEFICLLNEQKIS